MTDEADNRTVADVLLDRYGHRSLAEYAEIPQDRNPHHVFQLLQLAALLDGRVDPETAVDTFVTLREQRLTTAGHVDTAGASRISGILAEAGYSEGDTTRITIAMTDTALHLLEDHGGDLNGLREDARHDARRERELLGHFADVERGIVDAFCREVQMLWEEQRPFADKGALDAAGRLGLGSDAESLRSLVDDEWDFVRLVDALVRVRHEENGYQEIRDAAA